jgi:hypothetical protein
MEQGALKNGLPYNTAGAGTPLPVLRWSSTEHVNPTG